MVWFRVHVMPCFIYMYYLLDCVYIMCMSSLPTHDSTWSAIQRTIQFSIYLCAFLPTYNVFMRSVNHRSLIQIGVAGTSPHDQILRKFSHAMKFGKFPVFCVHLTLNNPHTCTTVYDLHTCTYVPTDTQQ